MSSKEIFYRPITELCIVQMQINILFAFEISLLNNLPVCRKLKNK